MRGALCGANKRKPTTSTASLNAVNGVAEWAEAKSTFWDMQRNGETGSNSCRGGGGWWRHDGPAVYVQASVYSGILFVHMCINTIHYIVYIYIYIRHAYALASMCICFSIIMECLLLYANANASACAQHNLTKNLIRYT